MVFPEASAKSHGGELGFATHNRFSTENKVMVARPPLATGVMKASLFYPPGFCLQCR